MCFQVFRQLLELQSKIELWKLPRCIFGVSPGDVAQAGLRGAAKHLSEHPNVTPRNAKKKNEAETNSIDLVVLEFQVVHKDQSMAHFPAKVAGENLMHKKVLAWNFRVLRHTGKTFSSSPTTRTFTSTQWTREKASQVLDQICLAKSYLFINLNDQWFQYIPMMYLKKVNPKKSKFTTNPWLMATFHLHKWVQFHEVPPKRAPRSIWKKCHLRIFWNPEIQEIKISVTCYLFGDVFLV